MSEDSVWVEKRVENQPGKAGSQEDNRRQKDQLVSFDRRKRKGVEVRFGNHGSNPKEIAWALAIARITQKELAARLNVSPPAVNAVIKGNSRSHKIELAISEITQTPLHVLFPEWYEASDHQENWPNPE